MVVTILLLVNIVINIIIKLKVIFNTKTDNGKKSVRLKLEVTEVDYCDCKHSDCCLKEYRCNGINCNVKLVEMLK